MVDDRIEEVMGEGGFNTYVPQTRLESGEVVSCVRTRYSVLMWFVGRTKSLLEWSNSELHQPSLPRLYRRWGDRMGDEIVSNQRLWVRDLLDQEENELLSISTPPSWFTSFDWTTEEVTRV
jgi:hypothetical protein